MKKIIIAMAAIAAAFTMASCNKELVEPEKNTTVGESVITASIENDLTKASLEGNDTDGYKVFWSEGDDLFVGDTEAFDWEAKFTLDDSSAGSSKGTFLWHEGDYFMPLDEYYTMPKFVKGTEYQALYPFDLVEKNLGCLIWKTEQTYDTKKRYIPMFSEERCTENGTADFTFKNLGGLLRLTVKGTATISSIRISSADDEIMSGSFYLKKDVNGDFAGAMGFGSGDVFNYITLDCGTNGVELKGEQGTDFYISMPCHYIYDGDNIVALDGYSDVTITLTDIDGKTCVKKLSSSKKLVIERSKITTASFTASEFKANIPEGALPGKFTVNKNGDQVYFSQGNLYWDGDSFEFESNQTNWSESNWDEEGCHVSHFFWSKNKYNARTSPFEDSSESTDDVLFTNVSGFEVNGQQDIWRALSSDELTFLLGTTDPDYTNHRYVDKRFAAAKVNDINGLLIFPDDFTWNNSMGEEPKQYNIMPITQESEETRVNYEVNSYDADKFTAIQKAGVVFLPVTGYYVYEEYSNLGFGYYWSSDSSTNEDYYAHSFFFGNGFFPGGEDYREYAFPIRLVTDCE